MKNRYLLFALALLFFFTLELTANERSATELLDLSYPVGINLAIKGAPAVHKDGIKNQFLCPWRKYLEDWDLIFTEDFKVSVPEGMYFGISFDPQTEAVDYIDFTYQLSATQNSAIERAPAWLRQDLYDNFRRFSLSVIADLAAQQILDAPDPYVDEVAFQMANLGPGLFNNDIYFQLPLENAEDVYAVDAALDYVEIVDYGDSNDDDYYSTCVYTIKEEDGSVVQVEIDKYYYYWFVVHPKLSDEVPTYINPESGSVMNPPNGVFWRDYLWNHADSGYPLYSDEWTGCQYLWDKSNAETDAINVVNGWISDVMEWNVGGERPIQPVRIYHLHMGYCGEHQDIRGAAGRIALIPTNNTSNGCEDHVWNEFWEEEWIHWDGGDINNPLLYENGWGKTLSGVYSWKGNGYTWNCAERYSAEVCTLYVNIYDSEGKPADGVNIRVYSENWPNTGLATAARATTPSNGQAIFLLGDAQNYYIRVDGPLGSYPAIFPQSVEIIEDSEPGAVYTWEYTYEDTATADLAVSEAPASTPLDQYIFEIDFECLNETVYGNYFANNEFGEEMDSGQLDFFFCDANNYGSYLFALPAEGYNLLEDVNSALVEYNLSSSATWYGMFSTREVSNNRPLLQGTVNIYSSSAGIKQPGADETPIDFALQPVYPNPFNSEASLNFSLPLSGRVEMAVYNLRGQKAVVLTDRIYSAGYHSLKWNAAGLSSGIYLVRMSSEGGVFTQKVCLVK